MSNWIDFSNWIDLLIIVAVICAIAALLLNIKSIAMKYSEQSQSKPEKTETSYSYVLMAGRVPIGAWAHQDKVVARITHEMMQHNVHPKELEVWSFKHQGDEVVLIAQHRGDKFKELAEPH